METCEEPLNSNDDDLTDVLNIMNKTYSSAPLSMKEVMVLYHQNKRTCLASAFTLSGEHALYYNRVIENEKKRKLDKTLSLEEEYDLYYNMKHDENEEKDDLFVNIDLQRKQKIAKRLILEKFVFIKDYKAEVLNVDIDKCLIKVKWINGTVSKDLAIDPDNEYILQKKRTQR